MTEREELTIEDQAIAWHLRLRDGADEDWDSFVDWLEADPARSAAYDAVVRADRAIQADAFPPSAANDEWDDERPRRSWSGKGAWGTALAAAAAGVVALVVAQPWAAAPDNPYIVATAPGQQRTLALADGSVARLNGATRLLLDRGNPRSVQLATGEVEFEVRHDASRPFIVTAGDQRVTDVGTAFNMVRDGSRFSVEVIEGAVRYNRQDANVSLTAGQTLDVHNGGRPLVGRAAPQTMAGWRRGQLSYRAAPLANVAGDLSRSLGVEVTVDPSLASTPFTGSIRVAGGAQATVSGLAATLGLQARHQGTGWRIEPHLRATR